MKKKCFIVATLLVIFSLFAVSYTFATTNTVNNIRNAVGGAENVIEDAGKGITTGIKDGINTVENGAKDVKNNVKNGINNMGTNNNNYNITRTSSTGSTTDTGFLANVSNTVWSWLIIAIVGIVIVALVLFYANQNTTTTYHNDNNE